MDHKIARQDPTAPYADDADYLDDEIRWLQAKLASLPAFLDRRDPEARPRPPREADLLRSRIERRLAATREAGLVLGLDRLTTCNGLDAMDRLALLLAAAPVLRPEIESAYRLHGHALGLCPEVVFTVAGLDLRERLARRAMFTPGGRLSKAGLITTDLPDPGMPTDYAWSVISITDRAFRAITGADCGEARRDERAVGRVASVLDLFPQLAPADPV